MLLGRLTALRRLVLLAVIFIGATVVFMRNSRYNPYGIVQEPGVQNPAKAPVVNDAAGHDDIKQDVSITVPDSSKTDSDSNSKLSPSPSSTPDKEYLQEILKWDPPKNPDHWPPYDAYKDKDYDPNRWEGFSMNNGYYENGTAHLTNSNSSTPVPRPYLPYPDYNSRDWHKRWEGNYASCEGPRSLLLNESTSDEVLAYTGLPVGFPAPTFGSFEAVGFDGDVCFDRFSRYGAYGFDNGGAWNAGWSKPSTVSWETTKWGELQQKCLSRNQNRYSPKSRVNSPKDPGIGDPEKPEWTINVKDEQGRAPSFKSRTAILIRSWDSYPYTMNDLQVIRALITELSLLSGGEYQVFLLVNVKDLNLPIFTDPNVYREVLENYVPDELRDIAILWSEQICQAWYPKVGEWSVYWQQFMPLQWFAKTHPEFDYIWNWEMDARYTGQHYHFLETISKFAREQPRKYLWERSSRYWIPSVHGSWKTFSKLVAAEAAKDPSETVWGPVPATDIQNPLGPKPPTSLEADKDVWGVGEEADFIVLLPFFNPQNTLWSYRDKIFNYIQGVDTPRRVFINTVVRFSRDMLHAMHTENLAGRSMASEMWPGTVALQHGLKAVYTPHPIWMDRDWPPAYADAVFNAGPPGKPATGEDAVYSPDREHNFGGFSWYFWSNFPRVLYRRWLGWASPDDTGVVAGGPEWEQNRGRMCLPGMLLHPVKKVVEFDQ
ncbi:MAG: hypothetical protein M1819_006046 [Sarea resinae]|nr:MAG: hypothetical protein M1819_006046 [Sarea resinae]